MQLPDCAGASISVNESIARANDDNYINSDNGTNKSQSGFIVSDGQGQLTTLFATSNALDNSADDKVSRQIIQNSQHHKMSFDNHLQAL